MKGGKTMGPNGIPIEVWICLGDIAIVWLTKLFNHIFRSNKMPDEWSLMSGGEVYWYRSTRIKRIFKVVLITGELN